MSTCRGCEATVVWVVTEAGRAMPIDPDPVADGNLVMTGRHRETRGGRRTPEVGYLTEGTLFPSDAARYVSHFATCPAADEVPQAEGSTTMTALDDVLVLVRAQRSQAAEQLEAWRSEVDGLDEILAALRALAAPASAAPPRSSTPATPRDTVTSAPERRGRRSDDEVRALWADYDPTTPLFTYLTVKGVAKGSRDHIVKRSRRLGVLPGSGAWEQQHNQAPTIAPLVGPDAPTRVPPYTDVQVRALWEALDPDIDVRSQLDDAGVPQRDHGLIRARARHRGYQMLGGQLTEHPTWKSANGPLKGPALSKEPARPSAALVVGCTSCPYTADSAVDMQRHCLTEHRRAATGAERTPLSIEAARGRGVPA